MDSPQEWPGAEDPQLPYVPILSPLLPSAERIVAYLRKIDATRIYTNRGPLVEDLERRLEGRLALPEGGIATASSGTSAIVGAILARAGRPTAGRPLAMIPAYTFVATAVAVEQCGYRPYFVDVDPETWMLCPETLRNHPCLGQTGLILPVAVYGRPVAQAPWQAFHDATGIPVVIDGAASIDRAMVAPGDFVGAIPAAFSLHATKAFATGEGGAIASTDPEFVQRTIQALNFGFRGARDCTMPSINGKLSEYHAAVGLAEDDSWTEKAAALQRVADSYRKLLGERVYGAPDLGLRYALLLCRDKAEAQAVIAAFDRADIGSRFWYGDGLHRQTFYANAARDVLGVTENLAARLIGLPMAPDLGEPEIARVAAAILDGVRRAGEGRCKANCLNPAVTARIANPPRHVPWRRGSAVCAARRR